MESIFRPGVDVAGVVPSVMLGGGPHGLIPFNFDLAQIVFTPGMAKRDTAADVFAASPIFQGHRDSTGTPDEVAFPNGVLLGNQAQDWYSNFDPYQGSVEFWIRPEWVGNDGQAHYLWYASANYYIAKSAGNNLWLRAGGQDHVVDISAWTAGALFHVVCSWDTKTTIDEMNYSRISLNDVHDYDQATQPTVSAADDIMHLGSSSVPDLSADAPIQGLHVYRRVLWDGTYGADAGNGDEIALSYALGVGRDPALTTGSWGTTFSLPTDSTPGALVTDTGEAWSHPHGSAELDHGFVDDGLGPHQESAILFNGNNTNVDLTSNPVFDDMPDLANGFQVGAWVRFDVGGVSADYVIRKYNPGWFLRIEISGTRLRGFMECAGEDASSIVAFADNPQWQSQPDGKWHWVLMSFHHIDNGGDSKVYIQFDGKWATTYALQIAGVGAYTSDAVRTMYYGATAGTFGGAGGWLALWNDVTQYPVGTDNIAPRVKPGAGGNLIEAWQCDDRVNAITATVATPANDGTLANGTWERKFNVEATPVMPQSVEFFAENDGIDFGSGANIDNLPLADCTIELWIRVPPTGGITTYILTKVPGLVNDGWHVRIAGGGVNAVLNHAANDCSLSSVFAIDDNYWHHVALDWDFGTLTGRLFLDGVLHDTDAAVGAYDVDAAFDCLVNARGTIGTGDGSFAIGAVRLSDNRRYTGNSFTPAARTDWYANDANAELITRMTDGAGATVTDYSGNAYHGTITFGASTRWNNTYDQTLDSPGVGPFQNGYVAGADGVDDGIGHLADVTAETDYVVRALFSPGQDSRGLWYLYFWDDIGGAQIGANYQMPSYHGLHTGGAASPTLDDNTARWPQSLIGAIAYNITQGTSGAITAVDGGMQSLTAGINWNLNDEYRIFWADGYHKHPWTEPMVIRTPIGCTRIDVRVLSADGEGTLYVHQVEVQESLLDNGDHESLQGGNPELITGWINDGLDAGDTQAEAVTIHAGAQSMEWNPGAIEGERMYDLSTVTTGGFLCGGISHYGDGVAAINMRIRPGGRGCVQYSAVADSVSSPVGAAWAHVPAVFRVVLSVGFRFAFGVGGGATGDRFTDDAYLFSLDDVTLAVTPAIEANCLESGGVRVVGRATCVQNVVPAALLQATQGWIRWRSRPRHAAANLDAFGEVPGSDYLMRAWGNAANYIDVFVTAANNIRLEFNDGGGVHLVNWNCAGAIVADTEYLFGVRYNPAQMQLFVDNVVVATIVQPPNFAVVPTVGYWGSRNTGDRQGDAVFIDP